MDRLAGLDPIANWFPSSWADCELVPESVDHRPTNSGTSSQSGRGRQVDPSSTPHLHQNGQSGSALPAPVGGAPLPALTQLQRQAPTAQTRLLQEKFLHGFEVGGRDPSSADHTPRLVLRPSATQLRN